MKEVGMFAADKNIYKERKRSNSPFKGNHIPGAMKDFIHACLKHSELLKEWN